MQVVQDKTWYSLLFLPQLCPSHFFSQKMYYSITAPPPTSIRLGRDWFICILACQLCRMKCCHLADFLGMFSYKQPRGILCTLLVVVCARVSCCNRFLCHSKNVLNRYQPIYSGEASLLDLCRQINGCL